MRTVSEISGTALNTPTFELRRSQKKRKRKGLRKYLKRLQLKTSLTWKRKQPLKYRKHRVSYRIIQRRNPARHILTKLTKTKHKEIILKAAREKQQITYKGNLICLAADLSAETLQARREWQDILKVVKGENLQPRLLDLARISFKIDGEIKSFSDKQKLREFSTTKPALQQMLKGLIQSKNTREGKRSTKPAPNN